MLFGKKLLTGTYQFHRQRLHIAYEMRKTVVFTYVYMQRSNYFPIFSYKDPNGRRMGTKGEIQTYNIVFSLQNRLILLNNTFCVVVLHVDIYFQANPLNISIKNSKIT